jgi:hypothetical protein
MEKFGFGNLRLGRVTISCLITFSTFLLFWVATYALRNSNSHGAVDSQINLSFMFTALIVAGLCLFFIRFNLGITLVYAVILGLVCAYLTTSVVLLNVDRSRSFYVLSWVEQYEFSSLENERDFSSVRSQEVLALNPINRRIAEQVNRGFISSERKTLELTSKGKFTLASAEFFAKYFRLSGWYLNKS